jgi:hypothetical protein
VAQLIECTGETTDQSLFERDVPAGPLALGPAQASPLSTSPAARR